MFWLYLETLGNSMAETSPHNQLSMLSSGGRVLYTPLGSLLPTPCCLSYDPRWHICNIDARRAQLEQQRINNGSVKLFCLLYRLKPPDVPTVLRVDAASPTATWTSRQPLTDCIERELNNSWRDGRLVRG